LKKLSEISLASDECCEFEGDELSKQVALARRLESEGHQTICVGRAMVTIERADESSETPDALKNWGALKISIYSDPDVSGHEEPTHLFIEGGRNGLVDVFVQYERGAPMRLREDRMPRRS